jgi:hypothetical protein
MWYPNRPQWRVIWGIATILTLLAFVQAVNGDPGLLFIMVLVDGAFLIWKFQNVSTK